MHLQISPRKSKESTKTIVYVMFRQHNSWLQSPLTDSAVTFESGSVSLSGHINNNNDYDSRNYQRPMTSSTLKHDMNGSRASLHSRSDVTHWNGKPHIREENGRSNNSDMTSVTSQEVRGTERKRGGAVNRTTRLPSSASSMISSQRTHVGESTKNIVIHLYYVVRIHA